MVGFKWNLLHISGSRHHKYVGSVSYISVDPSAKSSRGVVVASETGVLAVLDAEDGGMRKST